MSPFGFISLRIAWLAASIEQLRPLNPRSLLIVLLLAKLLLIAPMASDAGPGVLRQIIGPGQAWADESGESEGDDGAEGDEYGGAETGNDGDSTGGFGFGLSVSAFLSALQSHGKVAASHKLNGTLSVTYSDGWTEQVVGRTYRLLDRRSRMVVARPARASDRARLNAAIQR
ncbi:MAG: hypothetical protein K8H74_13850 [Notoacmeibacter sp.]|nr:hypothetical protein [Notoacmeibacter sp.]